MLKNLALRGLIAGPLEAKEVFMQRCLLSPSNAFSISLFGISPDWIEVNYISLPFWEGGCVYIDEKGISLNLSKAFEKKERFLIYDKKELLAHESVHAIRCQFEEPQFEEILAYRTAGNTFRCYFGPFFQTPRESKLFIFTLACITLLNFFSPFATFFILPILSFGLIRLAKNQRIYSRTLAIFKEVADERAMGATLFLTDREMILFSQSTKDEVLDYLKNDSSLRISQLREFIRCEDRE